LKVKDSGRLFFVQNYAEPYKIYLVRPEFSSILAVWMSTTSMAIFSNPLFATYSGYARNASIILRSSAVMGTSCEKK